MSNRVKVEIYGQSYTLSGDLDETYVHKLARYVDGKMNAVAEATHLSELAIKITNEAIEPLSARVTATIEQMSKPVFAA